MSGTVPYSFTLISNNTVPWTSRLNGTTTGQNNYSGLVPAMTNDQPVDMSFVTADLAILSIYTTSYVEVSVNDVHGGSPIAIFGVEPGVPYLSFPLLGASNPIPYDVTRLYITNPNSTDANVTINVWLTSSTS